MWWGLVIRSKCLRDHLEGDQFLRPWDEGCEVNTGLLADPASPGFASCLPLAQSLSVSKPRFPHFKNRYCTSASSGGCRGDSGDKELSMPGSRGEERLQNEVFVLFVFLVFKKIHYTF